MGQVLENSPGNRLRRLRDRLGFSLRDVEAATAAIAEHYSNRDYAISLGRLSEIENLNAAPSIFKLFSLSLVYRIDLRTLFSWYGMDLQGNGAVALPKPKLTHIDDSMAGMSRVAIPTFEPGFSLDKTTHVGRMIQSWGHLPLAWIEKFTDRRYTYGYIGEDDYTMFPIVPPGTFVQVDESQSRIVNGNWTNEYERPIYFVETREGYICCWCSLTRPDQIILEGHPLSHVAPRIKRHPQEAEVLGRVVGVAMRLEKRRKEGALSASSKQS